MQVEIIYKKKEGISSRKLGIDLMLYDEIEDKVHILNETGALIWELLNGGNTKREIEKKFLAKYPETVAEEITRDIDKTIQKLLSEKLISYV